MAECNAVRAEMNAIAGEFRRSYTERDRIVADWQRTLDMLAKRDESIDASLTELKSTRDEIGRLNRVIEQKKQFLEEETRLQPSHRRFEQRRELYMNFEMNIVYRANDILRMNAANAEHSVNVARH